MAVCIPELWPQCSDHEAVNCCRILRNLQDWRKIWKVTVRWYCQSTKLLSGSRATTRQFLLLLLLWSSRKDLFAVEILSLFFVVGNVKFFKMNFSCNPKPLYFGFGNFFEKKTANVWITCVYNQDFCLKLILLIIFASCYSACYWQLIWLLVLVSNWSWCH